MATTSSAPAPTAPADSAAAAAASVESAPEAPATPATSGLVLYAGSASHSLTGRNKDTSAHDGVPQTEVLGFSFFPSLEKVPISRVISGPTACHYVAISATGDAYIWGRNEKGQLGTGDLRNVYEPLKIQGLPPIRSAAVARGHTLLLTTTGEVYAAGDGNKGQLGLGSARDLPVVQWTLCKGLPKNVRSVAAGQEFSLAASPEGGLFSCGSEENGQCGSGRTGEHIESSKVGFGVLGTFTKVNSQDLSRETITAVTAGAQHGACLTQSGVAFTWGAGGYGRLGHRSTADELRPKRVQGVADCRIITAGTTCTYFVCGQGEGTQLLLCGILKKTGDSNMYPKAVPDAGGVPIRAIAVGNTSTILVANDIVATWGPSPTQGELGYGPKSPLKSSTKPKVLDYLEGTYAIDCAMGSGASVIILDVTSDTPEGRKARLQLERGLIPPLPTLAPKYAEGAGLATSAAGSGDGEGAGGKRKAGAAAGGPAKGKKASKK